MKNNYKYVAHLDMLGMTEAIRCNANEAWGALSDLRLSENNIDANYKIKLPASNLFADNRVYKRRFSDTIILFTLDNKVEDLYAILFKSVLLFLEALKKCIPLRGGISYGEFFINFELDMFLGKALVDAHHLGETAQWLGIVIDDVIYQNRNLIPDHQNQPFMVRWDLPIKNEKEIRKEIKSVLNWPALFMPTVALPISVEDFYKPFESLFGNFNKLHGNVQGKYVNTTNFINYQLTEKTI